VSRVLLGVRSSLSTVAALLWILVPGSLALYPLVLPASVLFPSRRKLLVSRFMKFVCWGIDHCLRAGGARFQRVGRISTAEPVLVLMNHQSLLDIVTATIMAQPYVPAFVTRRRYARRVPVVSTTVRWLGCPVVDPKRDPRGAIAVMREAGRSEDKGVLLFPEGHRTLDGEIRPFRTAGALALLGSRRLPVTLVVTDGFWGARRLVDFVFNCGATRGRTEVLGPFPSPEREEDLPAFLEEMRQRMVAHLHDMRKRREGVAA
jgi:1-acyl-sn-glycerol-3-phosphate acyltransferase